MPLGIEQNNLAPALIQGNGQALVQGIRQIGQQISGHLTEMQTKRDLAALGQEAQSLSVDSNDFPVQLAQLVTRHPLAARDERGKMLLAPLGQAHGFWRAEEADARAFERAMRMQAQRTTDSRTAAEEEEARRRSRPIPVAGVGLVQPNEIDEVTGQPKVLVAAPPRTMGGEFRASPQGTYSTKTGLDPQGNPLPLPVKKTSNIDEFRRIAARRQALETQVRSLDRQIDDDRAMYKSLKEAEKKEEEKVRKGTGKFLGILGTDTRIAPEAERSKLQTESTIMGGLADEKIKRRDALLNELNQLADEVLPDPEDAAETMGLPPLPANAAAQLPQIDSPADAAKLPSGTQFRDKNGIIRRVP